MGGTLADLHPFRSAGGSLHGSGEGWRTEMPRGEAGREKFRTSAVRGQGGAAGTPGFRVAESVAQKVHFRCGAKLQQRHVYETNARAP